MEYVYVLQLLIQLCWGLLLFSGISSDFTWDNEGAGDWIRSLLSIVEELNGAGDKVSGDTTMVEVQIILEALGLFSSKAEVSGPLEVSASILKE